jgi:hypothetical protein
MARKHAEQCRFANAAARENSQTLALTAGRKTIERFHAGFKSGFNALARERIRRLLRIPTLRQVRIGPSESIGSPRAFTTRPLSSGPTGTLSATSNRNDGTAGLNAVNFTQRHQKHAITAKSYHFGQNWLAAAWFDPANITDRADWPGRFNYQPDQLRDVPSFFEQRSFFDPMQKRCEPIRRARNRRLR